MRRFLRDSLAGLAVLAAGVCHAADFAGGGGAIPDANSNGLDIPIAVSGVTQVKTVRVAVTLTHSFVGDLRVTLVSPGGNARLQLFGLAGYKRSGSMGQANNLQGTYVFDDAAAGDFWQAVAAGTPVAPGTFRTSTAGTLAPFSDHGGCATYLGLVFSGLSGAAANGNWTLNVTDLAGGDLGSVTSVVLSVDDKVDIFRGGFEESGEPLGIAPGSRNCKRSFNDMTGSGGASYIVARNTGGGPGGALTWFVKENNGLATGAETSFLHGNAGDFFAEGDFDGDGIGDAVTWRSTTGTYAIRRSSQPSPVLNIGFGQSGDDISQIGDYDGDGITDLAVYRAGATSGMPSFTRVRYSSTGQVASFQTGENGAFAGGGSDLDGDGKADVHIQNSAGGGTARFRSFGGLDGVQFDDFIFGTPTDVFVTGSHTGSAVGDATVVRGMAGQYMWTTRDGETGIVQPVVTFGASTTDFVLSGDYDGDGIDDYAVWRPNADPMLVKFIVRRSTNTAVPLEVNFGKNGDYAVANFRRH